jgi:hypothetical protein
MTAMKKAQFLIAAASVLALSSPALLAHTDEILDTQKAPNGGQLRLAGVYHYELVVTKDSKEAKDNPVIVFVTDHDGKKVASSGANGTATILFGKTKVTATLAPDGDNRLKGMAKYLSGVDMKVIVSVTFPGKAAEQARFTPLTAAKDGHLDHKH